MIDEHLLHYVLTRPSSTRSSTNSCNIHLTYIFEQIHEANFIKSDAASPFPGCYFRGASPLRGAISGVLTTRLAPN